MKPSQQPQLLLLSKIWDQATHSALTDLVRHHEIWYCVFRESDSHVFGKNGVIRILQSQDNRIWIPLSIIEENGVDLRDPKLSVTPDDRLMLLMGGSHYQGKALLTRQPRVTFSSDGKSWSPLQKICEPLDWLWRVTWHKKRAWGVSYRSQGEQWQVLLYRSDDGIVFHRVVEWNIPGKPNETTLRFLPDNTMVALVRRNLSGNGHAWIGTSPAPYTDWVWKETKHHVGGPNFLILPNGRMWAAGRLVEKTPYGYFEKTALLAMTLDSLKPSLLLPSGGHDSSYPGMVYHEGSLWISYYSSHEGKTAVYFSQILLG